MKGKNVLTVIVIIFLNSSFFPQLYGETQDSLISKRYQEFIFNFHMNRSDIDIDYLLNATSLYSVDSLLKDSNIVYLDSIYITGAASPDGNIKYNERLAQLRGKTISDYLIKINSNLDEEIIKINPIGENWDDFIEFINSDANLPQRDEIISFLYKEANPIKRETFLRDSRNRLAWNYVRQNYLKHLRKSTVRFQFHIPPVIDVVEIPYDTISVINEDYALPTVIEVEIEPEPEIISEIESTNYNVIRPFAIKSNLLFDLATILNVELEVPLGKRFSVAGEWTFPWWLWENKQNCLEVLSGNIEGRFWFKPKYDKQDVRLNLHNPLTGWFVGVYGGLGLYDLEWKKEGYQGEFFIASGISGGYILPIKRNFNLEFSLGIGFLRSKYRHYHAKYSDIDDSWHLIRQYNGRHSWFGPTKAKVSFIWYPHFTIKQKGGHK